MYRKASGLKTLIVTGGIASGKSQVCSFLEKRGVPVYYADTRTKELYAEDTELMALLENTLGVNLTDFKGQLDRLLLSRIIFSDPEKKAAVDAIVHPRVVEDYNKWKEAQTSSCGIAIMETAIFPDREPLASIADFVLLLRSDAQLRLQRAVARGFQTSEDVQRRMEAQHYDEVGVDFVIDNDSDLDHLEKSVEEVLNKLTKLMLNLPDNKTTNDENRLG